MARRNCNASAASGNAKPRGVWHPRGLGLAGTFVADPAQPGTLRLEAGMNRPGETGRRPIF